MRAPYRSCGPDITAQMNALPSTASVTVPASKVRSSNGRRSTPRPNRIAASSIDASATGT